MIADYIFNDEMKEKIVKELNSRIEYQENMLNTISSEFRDQIEIINRYDSSYSDITMTLIKMKNKFEVLEDRPKETKEMDITKRYLMRLEQQIISEPSNYLWSHKRWKHKREK